ncbi:MAG: hypothetical protein IJ424_00780 [Oscillospiraceae bacterium]|nr:hypothetical protein [Oscillospiraceae bacterium]
MNRFENEAEKYIFENIESLDENELLELSNELDNSSAPSAQAALDTFRREYLPNVSVTSLYEVGKIKQMRNFNIKTMLIVAVIAVVMVASSMVSFAAGVASGEEKTNNTSTDEQDDGLKTRVVIDGIPRELFIVKPIEESDLETYIPSNRLEDIWDGKNTNLSYYCFTCFADEQANILNFKLIEPSEERHEQINQKSIEKFGEKAGSFKTGDVIEEAVYSQKSIHIYEAGDFYFETVKGRASDNSMIFAYCDTNFQIETSVSIYAYCYNAERDIYQEFVISRTFLGGIDLCFEAPEGWEIVYGNICVENVLIPGIVYRYGENYSVNGDENDPESIEAFRDRINEALEKHQQEKEQKNDIINKIESNQSK